LLAAQGQELGLSDWFIVDQGRIDAFAEVTEDRQFIHIDPGRAAQTPFGGTIAHGMLTLSLMSGLAYHALPQVEGTSSTINYGFNKVRFLAPVPEGSRVRGRFVLTEALLRGRTDVMARIEATVEIEGADHPALKAEWLLLYRF
jgi:acyl dehydratase